VVTITSVLQVLMSLVCVRVPKLDLKKSQLVVTTPCGLQVFLKLLVGVQVPKLDPEKSQWVVMTPSGL